MKDHSDLCYDKTCRTLAAIIVTQDDYCRWIATERMRQRRRHDLSGGPILRWPVVGMSSCGGW